MGRSRLVLEFDAMRTDGLAAKEYKIICNANITYRNAKESSVHSFDITTDLYSP